MRRALGAALLGAVLAAPSDARELWSSGEASLEFSGSFRQIAAFSKGTDEDEFQDVVAANLPGCGLALTFANCPAFDVVNDTDIQTSFSRLRTRFDLRITPQLSAVLVYDHEARAGDLDTFEAQLGRDLDTEQWLDLDWNIKEDESFEWEHLFYRGYVFFESEQIEVTLGRQRIPWGVGRLWNPIDRLNAIGPLAIEPDQNPGVDAVNLRWVFSGFTYLEAVYAAADDVDDQSYAARLHGMYRDVDYSLVVGVFEKAVTLGFDLEGNLGGAAARTEVVWAHSDRSIRPVGSGGASNLDDFWQAIFSVDYLFDLGSGLYALVEHLYNGNDLGFGHGRAGVLLPFFEETGAFVDVTSNARFGGSRVITHSSNLTGFQLGYDLTPELRADMQSIYDWDGESASFFPTLRYDAFDWLEITLGGQFFAGPRRSQYGDAETLGYLIAEVFF